MAKTADGARFGLWTVTSQIDGSNVNCICECGTERRIHRSNLTSGKTKSCGCDRGRKISEVMRTHGKYGTPTYSTWSSMMTRCTNERSRSFQEYGGRGIKVCAQWQTFEGFLADMGEKPTKGMSIERLNVNGNYEPGNCVWATHTEQTRNTRRTRLTADQVLAMRTGDQSVEEIIALTGCAKSTAYMAKSKRNWSSLE